MRYLVNRETKEHEVYDGQNYDATKYRIVAADSDGWIKWEGGECPLPGGAAVEVRFVPGYSNPPHRAGGYQWACKEHVHDIIAYRPVLDKSTQCLSGESAIKAPDGWSDKTLTTNTNAVDSVLERAIEEAAAEEVRLPTLLERLKAAHEAAQRIPEMEAELREVLGSMGYDLVARSPFVGLSEQYPLDPEFAQAIEENIFNIAKSEPDMSDWRNWRPGDLVERVRDPVETCAKLGGVYRLTRVDTTEAGTERAWYIAEAGSEVWASPNNFRWHSRPEVKS